MLETFNIITEPWFLGRNHVLKTHHQYHNLQLVKINIDIRQHALCNIKADCCHSCQSSLITNFTAILHKPKSFIKMMYSEVSHLMHLDLTNLNLRTFWKSTISNLTIQNSYLTAIIPDARDQISNFLLIAEFCYTSVSLPPSLPSPLPPRHSQCNQIGFSFYAIHY